MGAENDLQQCSTCGQMYPFTVDYFIKVKRNKSGLGKCCKACDREYKRNWYHYGRSTPKRFDPEEMRTCPKCEICKPITIEYFKPNRTRPNGWEVWCRECFNAYCRARTKARPDLRREKERRFAERHPEKYAAKIKQHRERTKERGGNKYAKRNIEKTRLRERLRWLDPERQAYDRARWERRKANGYNEHEQERYKQNPWPKRLKELRHRTLELSAPGIFAQEDLLAKVQYWGWRCRYCNIRLTFATLTIDHRIPLSRGGSNWLANLVPACRSCNSSKHNKKEDEYFEWLKND